MAAIRGVEGVSRFMALLQTINETGGATVSDLARATGLSRGSANRFIVSLHDLGYIYRNERDKTYRPTGKTFELSKGAAREQRMEMAVRPLMRQTTQKVGWSVNFTTIKQAQLAVLAHTDLESPLVSDSRDRSSPRPLLGRAAGHVLLAHMPDVVRVDLLNILLESDPDILRRAELKPRGIAAVMQEVRRVGYAQLPVPGTDMVSLAVPVPTTAPIIFALAVSFDPNILAVTDSLNFLLSPLKTCAAAIARRIETLDTERWLPAPLPSAARPRRIPATESANHAYARHPSP